MDSAKYDSYALITLFSHKNLPMELAKHIVSLKNDLVNRDMQCNHYVKYQDVMKDVLLDLIHLEDDYVYGWVFRAQYYDLYFALLTNVCIDYKTIKQDWNTKTWHAMLNSYLDPLDSIDIWIPMQTLE